MTKQKYESLLCDILRRSKIAIIHPFYDILGGAEKLSLSLAKVLSENNYDVSIITFTPINDSEMKKLYGYSVSDLDVNVIVIRDRNIERMRKRAKERFTRLRHLMVYKNIFEIYVSKFREDYDILVETQSNIPSNVDLCYIHYPAIKSYYINRSRIHQKLYEMLVMHYINKLSKYRAGKILTNSIWTASHIYSLYRIFPDVVYPPVDTNTYIDYCNEYGCPHDKKFIVTISRFSPEKRLELIIDIAKMMPDYKFYIFGSTSTNSNSVLALIRKKINEKNVFNVEIKINASLETRLKILSHARFYVHPPFPEPFGISIVEAMATGLVPVVLNDGGGYYDVVSKINKRLGYNDIANIVQIINYIDSNNDRYIKYSKKARKIAQEFSTARFARNILQIIRLIEETKNLLK